MEYEYYLFDDDVVTDLAIFLPTEPQLLQPVEIVDILDFFFDELIDDVSIVDVQSNQCSYDLMDYGTLPLSYQLGEVVQLEVVHILPVEHRIRIFRQVTQICLSLR